MAEISTIGEVAEVLNSRRVPLSKAERTTRAGHFPYYGATGVLDHIDGFLFDGLHVLVGEDGTVANERGRPMTQLVDGRFWVSNHAHVIRGHDEIDTRFLYYALAEVVVRPFVTGSAQPKLSLGNLRRIPISWPARSRRTAAVEMLGALDDKIQSNRRLALTCEALSRVLLEAELGNSSEVVPLGQVARFRNSERKPLSAFQRAEMSGARVYPYFGATGVFDHVDDYLFDELTALVGEDGSVVNGDGSPVVQLAWGKYWVNNHAHVLVGEGVATELLYVALKRSDVRPLVTGAVQAKVSMGNLRTLGLELPASAAREALGDILRLIIGRVRRAHDETAVLEATRDTLLPELLSGQFRVHEAEGMVGTE